MKFPSLLPGRARTGSLCRFLQRPQEICQSILPPSEQQLGSTEPPQISPGTQEGKPATLPSRLVRGKRSEGGTRGRRTQTRGKKNQQEQQPWSFPRREPAASSTLSLIHQQTPRPQPEIPPGVESRASVQAHVGFNVTPLQGFPWDGSDTQLLSRTFPFFIFFPPPARGRQRALLELSR